MTAQNDMQLLERGDIYFFYRPKVSSADEEEDSSKAIEDIQRFYIVLHPDKNNHYRLLVVGRKRLPETGKHEKHWSTVESVVQHPEQLLDALKKQNYSTKTRGERSAPEARACGEGVYCIVQAGRQTYLTYHLTMPDQPGEVQKELELQSEASYVLSVKNQKAAGIQSGRVANFPQALQEKFQNLRFIPANPVTLLNYPNAELLLIGSGTDLSEELKIDWQAEKKSFDKEKIFSDLRLWRNEHTTDPLFKGHWV